MPSKLEIVIAEVTNEVEAAQLVHPPMASHHEGYAVILEELDEYWDEVKKRPSKRVSASLREELRQVAAMAIRTMHDLT